MYFARTFSCKVSIPSEFDKQKKEDTLDDNQIIVGIPAEIVVSIDYGACVKVWSIMVQDDAVEMLIQRLDPRWSEDGFDRDQRSVLEMPPPEVAVAPRTVSLENWLEISAGRFVSVASDVMIEEPSPDEDEDDEADAMLEDEVEEAMLASAVGGTDETLKASINYWREAQRLSEEIEGADADH